MAVRIARIEPRWTLGTGTERLNAVTRTRRRRAPDRRLRRPFAQAFSPSSVVAAAMAERASHVVRMLLQDFPALDGSCVLLARAALVGRRARVCRIQSARARPRTRCRQWLLAAARRRREQPPAHRAQRRETRSFARASAQRPLGEWRRRGAYAHPTLVVRRAACVTGPSPSCPFRRESRSRRFWTTVRGAGPTDAWTVWQAPWHP
jgi:hypothetical protein